MQAKVTGEVRLVDDYDIFIGTTVLITCPWCYSPTLHTDDESECSVCRRGITQSDIDNYLEDEN